MDNKLSELKELAQMATPGPWSVSRDGMTVVSNMSHPIATLSDEFHRKLLRGEEGRDAEFIAEFSPNFVLSLIERLDAAEARVKELEEERERLNKESGNLSDQLGSCDRERRTFRDLAKSLEAEIARRDKAAGEVIYQFDCGEGWQDVDQTEYERYINARGISTRKVYTAPPPAVLPPPLDNWHTPTSSVMASLQFKGDELSFTTGANWMREQAAVLGCQPQKVVVLPPISRNESNFYNVFGKGFEAWLEARTAHDFWNEAIKRCQKALDAAGIPWKVAK